MIAWPEDCGRVTVAELPKIDRRKALVEFVELSDTWMRDNTTLCGLQPGRAYAVAGQAINVMGDSSLVVTYRPKTLAECEPERLIKAQAVYIVALENLIEALADMSESVADTFMPDVLSEEYPVIDALLNTVQLAAELRTTAEATLEGVKGKGCGADTA